MSIKKTLRKVKVLRVKRLCDVKLCSNRKFLIGSCLLWEMRNTYIQLSKVEFKLGKRDAKEPGKQNCQAKDTASNSSCLE